MEQKQEIFLSGRNIFSERQMPDILFDYDMLVKGQTNKIIIYMTRQ